MKRSLFLKISTLVMAIATMGLTSCKKEAQDYLIGTWNELQVTSTIKDQTTTKKLNGTFTFEPSNDECKGKVTHVTKKGAGSVSQYGTWEFFPTVGSLWITYEGEDTETIHVDQIDDHNMNWSYYKKNRANEVITYNHKLSR